MNPTAVHEASHCAAAWMLGRDVAYTWVACGSVWPGEPAGHARIPIEPDFEPSQVLICLIGYMSTGEPDWPPSFADACAERLEGLGIVLRHLDATEEQYEATVQLTRRMLADPDFIALRDSIARCLDRCPRIERETIERLAQIHFNPEYQDVAV